MVKVQSLDHTRLIVVADVVPTDLTLEKEPDAMPYQKFYKGNGEHRRNVWTESLGEAKAYTDNDSVRKLVKVLTEKVKVDHEWLTVTISAKLVSKKELMIARIKG